MSLVFHKYPNSTRTYYGRFLHPKYVELCDQLKKAHNAKYAYLASSGMNAISITRLCL